MAALVVAFSAFACGGGTDAGAPNSSENEAAEQKQEIEDAVRAYGAARGGDICGFVTQEYLDSVGGISRCARDFDGFPPAQYRIRSINVSGSKATVRAKEASTGKNRKIDVVLEDGEWKVDPR